MIVIKMKLNEIEQSVEYDKQNLMEMNGKVNAVDVEKGIIIFTSDNQKYQMNITEYGIA